MLRIGIILGSTRPGRRGELVARWLLDLARRHPLLSDEHAEISMHDLNDAGLPLLNEPVPAIFGQYQHEHTHRWASRIAALDAFVFVTPEYNHSVPASLKNAIDHLHAEWNDKAAGIVSYGVNGGVRAAEHLRQVLAEVKVAAVRTQPAFSVFDDFIVTDPLLTGEFAPRDMQGPVVTQMLDEVFSWGTAMRSVREAAPYQPAAA